jgi:hypothetical protein
MRSVALYGLDEVRDQVMALLQLHVDVGEGLSDALIERDQSIIRREREENENDENANNDPSR